MNSFFDKILVQPIAIIIQSLAKALPALILSILWIILSTTIASVLEKLTKKLLDLIKFNSIAEKIQISRIIPSFSSDKDYSGLLSKIIYWIVFIIFVLSALNSLGFQPLTILVQQFVLFIPKLIVAVIIAIIGYILGGFCTNAMTEKSQSAGIGAAEIIGKTSGILVFVLFILVSLYELNIARILILFLFRIILFTFSIIIGLSFGLGGKEIASQMLNDLLKKKNDNNISK